MNRADSTRNDDGAANLNKIDGIIGIKEDDNENEIEELKATIEQFRQFLDSRIKQLEDGVQSSKQDNFLQISQINQKYAELKQK